MREITHLPSSATAAACISSSSHQVCLPEVGRAAASCIQLDAALSEASGRDPVPGACVDGSRNDVGKTASKGLRISLLSRDFQIMPSFFYVIARSFPLSLPSPSSCASRSPPILPRLEP
ncbi:hypothetical protein F4804DRAFT_260366 [Jackrogersella minutella]|nr:hypothetical protein F4804DRAFT_260366 [Jackrogersella minutella]